MKTSRVVLVSGVLALLLSGSVLAGDAPKTTADWELFCDALAHNLDIPNEGVQLSTMQHIVYYSQFPEFKLCDQAVKNLIATVRNQDQDIQIRRLALSALYCTGSERGIKFMERQLANGTENDPRIVNMYRSAIYHYRKDTKPLWVDRSLIASKDD
jgi:hypothetical protein